MDQVVKILLRLDLVRAHLLVIFGLQETPSWDVENLSWFGTVFYRGKFWAHDTRCLGAFLQSTEITEI